MALATAKTCGPCNQEKPLAEFNRDRRTKDGRRSWCRSCDSAYHRKWRSDPENRERASDIHRRWSSENAAHKRQERHRWYLANQDKAKAQSMAWYHANRPQARARADARERALGPSRAEDIDYRRVLANDPCAYCGGKHDEIDHIVPASRGGSNEWTNLTSSCQPCNRRKYAHSLLDFLLHYER